MREFVWKLRFAVILVSAAVHAGQSSMPGAATSSAADAATRAPVPGQPIVPAPSQLSPIPGQATPLAVPPMQSLAQQPPALVVTPQILPALPATLPTPAAPAGMGPASAQPAFVSQPSMIPSTMAPTSSTSPGATAMPSAPPPSMPASSMAPKSPAPSAPQPSAGPMNVPPAPAPTTSSPTTPPSTQEEKPTSIDTIDLNEPGGNWLYKRIWWEKAEDRYEKIQKLVQRVFELRMTFFNKRTELDRTVFDPFYLQAGLGRGELEELLNYLTDEVEAQRKRQGSLDESERAFLDIMTKEKETLDQLKLDIEGIAKLDYAVDDTLSKLIEQLGVVRSYEQQAWENFKEISKVLNDKKAKELYYGMITFEENIAAIYKYIGQDLTPYFEQLIKTARDNIARIKSTLQTLKEKGIDFKKKAQELESKDSNAEREKIRKERERLEREREEAEAEAAKSWFGWMKGMASSVWDSITGVVGGAYGAIKGLFVSSSSEEHAEEHPETKKSATP